MGFWVVGLALITSFAGVACGLACIRQSTKSVTAKFRLVWVLVASSSIGGVGVAMPVFMLMLGLELENAQTLRYEATLTNVSTVISGISVFVALLIAGSTLNWVRLGIGAVVMAGGLGTSHLFLLSAIHVPGSVDRSLVSIIAVYVIALMISVLTIWFSLTVKSLPLLLGGSVVFAVLVIAMHYAGITGVEVHVAAGAAPPEGQQLFDFFVPFFIIGSLSLTVPITAILVAPDRREARQPFLAPDSGNAHSTSLAAASRGAAAQRVR